MKKLTLLSVCLVLCTLLSACGASTAKDEAATAPMRGDMYYSVATEDTAEKVLFDGAGALNYGSMTAGSANGVATVEQKLVYTSRVSLETEDFDTANQSLHSTIASLGGIIVSENAHNLGNVGYRSLSMTVRIPQASYDAFLAGLSESYNVASVQNSVDNMTERYYDNENRLKALRIQEERLFAMLEKAETVQDMLEIENRLCDVQYEIEALTNTQRTIDNDVKYATFYLNLNEVTKYTSPAPKTFGDRLGETVSGSGESFLEFAEGLLFVCIYLAPYILIMAGIAVIIVVSIRSARKKRAKAKKESEKKNEN